MKKLIAILTLVCLLIIPMGMSEDIELPSELEGEDLPAELELELEDKNHRGRFCLTSSVRNGSQVEPSPLIFVPPATKP